MKKIKVLLLRTAAGFCWLFMLAFLVNCASCHLGGAVLNGIAAYAAFAAGCNLGLMSMK